jgi:putrescine transport system permease protein
MKFFARFKKIDWGRATVLGVPYLWLILFLLIPFLIIFKISLSEMQVSQVPFKDLVTYSEGTLNLSIKLGNYLFIAKDALYILTFISSLKFAFLTTLFCLLIGYPFALCMARAKPEHRATLMMLVILPFWTSFLLRIYAWKGILTSNGILNNALISMGIISEPLPLINTPFSLTLGMVYAYLPFMIFPLYNNLVKQDHRLIEAALNLGATPWVAFWKVTFPLSLGGALAGALLVFIPAVGEFVIPELLGGPDSLMIGRVLWDEMFSNNDWPMAASVAVVLILIVIVPFVILNHYQEKRGVSGLA